MAHAPPLSPQTRHLSLAQARKRKTKQQPSMPSPTRRHADTPFWFGPRVKNKVQSWQGKLSPYIWIPTTYIPYTIRFGCLNHPPSTCLSSERRDTTDVRCAGQCVGRRHMGQSLVFWRLQPRRLCFSDLSETPPSPSPSPTHRCLCVVCSILRHRIFSHQGLALDLFFHGPWVFGQSFAAGAATSAAKHTAYSTWSFNL